MDEKQTKKFWQSKTIILNVLAIIAALSIDLTEIIGAGETLTLAGVINLLLRIVSETKISLK